MEKVLTYQQLSLLIESILKRYFISKSTKEFTGNHEEIHKNFYQLKQHFPEHFSRLSFNTNGHYPVSKDLDSILQDFQVCGIINKLNPKFRTIIFKGAGNYNTRKEKRIPFIKDMELETMASELTI